MVAALFLTAMAFAHGDEQHVMGKVIKVEDASITVKTKDGVVKAVMVTPSTKYMKGEAAATQKDLKVGDRVVIHAVPMGDRLHATEVKIGRGPAPEPQR